MTQFELHKDAIVFIGLGMLSGLLAQLILPGRGFGILGTIGIGIAGAFIGKFVLYSYLSFISDEVFRIIAAATVAAMVISVIINLIRGGEDRDLTHWRDS